MRRDRVKWYLRIDPLLKARVQRLAAENEISQNVLVERAIEAYWPEDEDESAAIDAQILRDRGGVRR